MQKAQNRFSGDLFIFSDMSSDHPLGFQQVKLDIIVFAYVGDGGGAVV